MPPDRQDMVEALAKSGLTSEQPNFEKVVEENLLRRGLSHRLHENFVKKFAVKPGYYHFDPIRQHIADQEVSNPFILVDPYWLKACLPQVDVTADEPDREHIEKLLPGRTPVFFSDVLGYEGDCRG